MIAALKYSSLFVFLVSLIGCSEKSILYSNLDELEVNEMIAILYDQGISANKLPLKDNMWEVQVETSHFSRAVNLLKEQGFPKKKYEGFKKVYQEKGLVSSPNEERIRYIHALQESLAQTISNIDGVVNARVHISLPEKDKREYADKLIELKVQENQAIDQLKEKIIEIVGLSLQKIIGTYDSVKLLNKLIDDILIEFKEENSIIIVIHPTHSEFIKSFMDEIQSRHTNLTSVKIGFDPELNVKECVIKSEHGSVRASLDNQLDVIMKTLRRTMGQVLSGHGKKS